MYDLSNGVIFNNLERPITKISTARHYLKLYISEMRRGKHMVTSDH